MKNRIKGLENHKLQLVRALSELGCNPENKADREFYKQLLEKVTQEIDTLKHEVWE